MNAKNRMRLQAGMLLWAFLLGAACAVPLFAQQSAPSRNAGAVLASSAQPVANRVVLARADNQYPVTPGDTYQLTYQVAAGLATQAVLVDGNYGINLGIFGTMNARGLTFVQLKARVEKLVAGAYPSSAPDLEISAVGEFPVYLRGAVPEAKFVEVWGLSRLGEVLKGNLGSYSSVRDITVLSSQSGSASPAVKRYDYFKAVRFGELADDPLMRPGDTVVVAQAGPRVKLSGEVRRPGTYELLPGDNLATLVESYGGGLLGDGDAAQVEIDRVDGSEPQRLYADLKTEKGRSMTLRDGDVVTVRAKTMALPVVFFEGAVIEPGSQGGQAAPGSGGSYGRITYAFRPGESLADAVRAISKNIAPSADLADAEILPPAGSDPTPVDLETLVHGNDPPGEGPLLKPLERIVIPWSSSQVTVIGAVARPGSYTFDPGKDYHYYLGLAGGIDTTRNSGGKVAITTPVGKPLAQTASIQAGDEIYVPSNSFFYKFNRVFPLVATSVSLLSAVATLVTVVLPYITR